MRNFDKAEKEAMKVLDDRDGLTVGEMQALHEMGDWNKISKSLFLGAVAGAKRAAAREPELFRILRGLPEDKLTEIRNHAEQLLMESAADRFKVCQKCGSENLTRKDRCMICEDCGAAGGIKIDSRGRVRLFWTIKPQ